MTNEPLRMQILNMIEQGDISAEEGLRWLEALAQNAPTDPSADEREEDKPAVAPDFLEKPVSKSTSLGSDTAEISSPPASTEHLPFDSGADSPLVGCAFVDRGWHHRIGRAADVLG